METRELGQSGIAVSRIILGCGNFGGVGSAPEFFGQGISEDEAFRIMDRAWELGITTFDTADAYGGGRSETYIGKWLETKGGSVRDTIVVETKTFNPNEVGADRGLSGARIRRQIDVSLRRLGLERVDLYLAHEFDPDVPQEETLRAFDELVRAGKVGAVGASNFAVEQLVGGARGLGARASRSVRAGCRGRSRSSTATMRTMSSPSAARTASGTRHTALSQAAGSPASTGATASTPRDRG